ncbi:MAG: SDR family NAD(P)-dependent oxidoreductase, partial [Alphaproteobacteria bacterium]|nr:SDR family NAD(P)-dependent oxidoreductase [Alphaproteobacteria bacterium]
MTVRRKTAFVTGAASGIGRAVATSLRAEDARIVLADRQAEALQVGCRADAGRQAGQ